MPREKNRQLSLLVIGIAASLIAITGDAVLGYNIHSFGDVAGYGIVRDGYGSIPLWCPVVSMICAMAAFSGYLPALWKVKSDLAVTHPKAAEVLWWSSLADALGWPLLHAAFCWPIYNYRILCDTVGAETAKEITVRFGQAVFPYAVFYTSLALIPFTLLFVIIVPGKSIYPRITAFFTPLLPGACIYFLFYHLLPMNSITYAAALGIMNECMLIMFTAFLASQLRGAGKQSAKQRV